MGKDNNDKMNLPMDYAIKSNKVRLINQKGQTDIISKDEAIARAKAEGKNLVQIAFNPSVFPSSICKIIDYGKFKYEQQKREKAAKKAARAAVADVKEVCFSIRIDDGDFNTKVSHIKEFLSDKKTKVKIVVKLSRREMSLVEMAKDLMKKVLSQCEGIATLDSNPTFNGGIMTCTIRPSK